MPKFKLIVTPKAIEEIQGAVDYYDEKQEGLGARFFNDLQNQLGLISNNPQYRSLRYSNIRMAHLSNFPYAAHFEIKEDKVIVNAVLCDYQDRDKRKS